MRQEQKFFASFLKKKAFLPTLARSPAMRPDLVPTFQSRAAQLDADSAFPTQNIADLADSGALTAPFPPSHGGQGLGTTPEGAGALLRMLRLIGQGHLATGRLYEGHVNAVKLVATYGTPAQLAHLAAIAGEGHLFGLWVTDGEHPLRVQNGSLHGGKAICSGAGHLSCALVTAQPGSGDPVLTFVTLDDTARAQPARIRLQGMRAATTGAVTLTNLPAEIIGAPGDYLRQPIFSAGAWRTSAVTLGGVDSLVATTRAELIARNRLDPHQLARLGEAFIARETAALWLAKTAALAEAASPPPAETAAYVNLARIAVEKAALAVIQLTQRSLGLSAFVTGHPAEATLRDLATYLRQPAPDETLTEAAAHFAKHEIPA